MACQQGMDDNNNNVVEASDDSLCLFETIQSEYHREADVMR